MSQVQSQAAMQREMRAWRDKAIGAERKIAALQAELAEARKDSERLDWLEKHQDFSPFQETSDPNVPKGEPFKFWYIIGLSHTLRAAIDAARSKA